MKVILNQDIPNIGEEGDITDVARGYARNYLIPRQLALPYTRQALALLESRRETIENRRAQKRAQAESIKSRLQNEPLEITMPAGDRGRLFGSVTSATIADALATKGIDVERKRIDVPDKTIKTTGTAYVRIRLYGDEEAELRVDVRAVGGKTAEATSAEPSSESTAESTAEPASTGENTEVDAAGAATAEVASQTPVVPEDDAASESEETT